MWAGPLGAVAWLRPVAALVEAMVTAVVVAAITMMAAGAAMTAGAAVRNAGRAHESVSPQCASMHGQTRRLHHIENSGCRVHGPCRFAWRC